LQSSEGDSVAIRKCVVSGFFMHAAQLQPDGTYRLVRAASSAGGRRGSFSLDTAASLHIHPSSVLHATTQSAAPKPAWVVFHEVVTTTKAFMRDVSVIEPAWLTECAPHYFQWQSGHRADIERHEAIAAAAAATANSADAMDTDGVVGEAGKVHRRLF